MKKLVSINRDVDTLVKAVKDREDSIKGRSSYSKVINYLIVLGLDRYNELFKTDFKPPEFDFSKRYRKTKV